MGLDTFLNYLDTSSKSISACLLFDKITNNPFKKCIVNINIHI